MGPEPSITDLKKVLVREVNSLFRDDGRLWKQPIVEVLKRLRRSGAQAVVFGGTPRSLLLSRLFTRRLGRPRDLDLVVTGVPFEDLELEFGALITRRTRFGGMQLRQRNWSFDMWPVGKTWALRGMTGPAPQFGDLPFTTPFNLEAVAVEAWPHVGRSRRVFSGNEQFFEGVMSRTLELNHVDNPHPGLTVVRALVLASELKFRVGPGLAEYISKAGSALKTEELDRLQQEHYGYVRLQGHTLRSLVDWIGAHLASGRTLKLPSVGQLPLWHQGDQPNLRIYWSEGPGLTQDSGLMHAPYGRVSSRASEAIGTTPNDPSTGTIKGGTP